MLQLAYKLQLGGAVAQLGARLDGIEEVVGSNPIGSTKIRNFLSAAHSSKRNYIGSANFDECYFTSPISTPSEALRETTLPCEF